MSVAAAGADPLAVLAGELAAPTPDWWDRAACRGRPVEWFYPETRAVEPRALGCCARCPVQVACLADALTRREDHGVWGGTLPPERHALRGSLVAGGVLASGRAPVLRVHPGRRRPREAREELEWAAVVRTGPPSIGTRWTFLAILAHDVVLTGVPAELEWRTRTVPGRTDRALYARRRP